MKQHDIHAWNVTPAEAVAMQNTLRGKVKIKPLDMAAIKTVAGADVSFNIGSEIVYAGIVVLSFPDLEVIERVGVRTRATFPYIPGLLSFRETPPILEAWEKLAHRPDVLIADGQGTAHPRRFGIACHLGILLDLPTLGCAKTLFVGEHDELASERGVYVPLRDKGEVIGAVVRTRAGVSPVYVSPGHRCDIESAVALTLRCATKTRLPETTRLAHQYVNALRRADAPGEDL